jgi:hypothetical protein
MARKPTSIADTFRAQFEGIGGPDAELPEEGIDIEVPLEEDVMLDGALMQENPDGSVDINFDPELPDIIGAEEHSANLAEFVKDMDLTGLAEQLMSGVEDDKRSRSEWENTMTRGIELLGLTIEDRTTPFAGACGVFDPLMAEAVIRWQATARGELMPASGPVDTEILGVETQETQDKAARIKAWMNLYLTELAPEYYEEFDQMLMWLPLVGSTFKKIYQDPILARPVARFITPKNFIISYNTSDLRTSPRFAHIIPMTKRQIKLAMLNGTYRDLDLGDPEDLADDNSDQVGNAVNKVQGIQPGAEGTEEYEIYEVYADLDLKGFENDDGIPLPYIVSIEAQTRKILSIRRNWREDDTDYQRINRFTHYKFIPGLGFYGLGYAHILGNSAKTATSIRRQLIDAGTLNNFPGGLRVKGMRFDDNNLGIGPTEFREIDTGGLPIQNAIMPMPYKEPSQVSLELLKETYEGARNLANTAEIAVGDGRQDAPVGTTVALMEAATRVQSATLKRAHKSLGKELKLIADLFGKYLPEIPYPFPVRGGTKAIMRDDFDNNIDVIPVSDPNISSSAQRMMRAEALLRFATQAPELHNTQEAFRQMYIEMGIDPQRVEMLLPNKEAQPPMPMDPLTENQTAMMGGPLKAGEYQDHDAHIASHMPLAEQNPNLQAHINEHMAMKLRVQVQQMIGQPLPPPGTPMPPEMENQLAMMVAQAMQQLAPQYKQQPQPDPLVQIEAEKVQQKAVSDQVKADVEMKKAEMIAQSEAADRETKETIAAMKLAVDLQKQDKVPFGG